MSLWLIYPLLGACAGLLAGLLLGGSKAVTRGAEDGVGRPVCADTTLNLVQHIA